jgi:hypothetical protein
MPTKKLIRRRPRPKSSSLVKRVKTLETKQKADDKSTERKVQFYNSITFLNNVWSANSDFLIRTQQGIKGQGSVSAGETRIGDSINLRSCTINFYASMPRNSDGVVQDPQSSTRCRLLLVDNLSGTNNFTISDILQSPTYYQTSPYKHAVTRGERYRVLGDYQFNLNATNKADHVFKFRMKLPKSGRVLHYNGSSDTNPSDLNVTMLWVAESISPLSANQPTLQYYVKSSFEDN